MFDISKSNKTTVIGEGTSGTVLISHNVNVGICSSERYDALQKSRRRLFGWGHRGGVPVTRTMCHEVSFNSAVQRVRFRPEHVSAVLAEETNMRQNREQSWCHHVRPNVTQPICDRTFI